MISLTFSQVAALWREDKRKYVKNATYAIYSQLCRCYILPAFGPCRGGDLGEAAIQHFADSLLARGYSLKTVKDTMLVFRMILRHGEKLGAWPHIEYTVHYPTQTAATPLPLLTVRQQQKISRYLRENFSFRNLGLLICLQSGLRIGEVCGLRWQDLDMETGVIHVGRTVQRIFIDDGCARESFLSIDTPKTASSVRDIPMSRELRELVRPFRKVTAPERYVLSNGAVPTEPRTYRAYFYRLLKQLDIPPVRFHALRHSFATRCIESKCDYKAVSAILGHASISTTLDLYVHPGYREKKQVIDRLMRTLAK